MCLTQSKTACYRYAGNTSGAWTGVWYTALTAHPSGTRHKSHKALVCRHWQKPGAGCAAKRMPVTTPKLQLHDVILATAACLCASTKGNCRSRALQSQAARQEGFSLGSGRTPRFRTLGPRLRPVAPRWTHPRALSYLFSSLQDRCPPAPHAAPHTQKSAAPCAAPRDAPQSGPRYHDQAPHIMFGDPSLPTDARGPPREIQGTRPCKSRPETPTPCNSHPHTRRAKRQGPTLAGGPHTGAGEPHWTQQAVPSAPDSRPLPRPLPKKPEADLQAPATMRKRPQPLPQHPQLERLPSCAPLST